VDQEIDINSFARMKFLMEYDLSKSPRENILSEQPRIRGTASPQQSDSRINLGQFTSVPQSTPKDPYNAQLNPIPDRYSSIYDMPTGTPPAKWDHDKAGKIELSLVLGGMGASATGYGAVVGVPMLVASTVVGITDALMYFVEGKPYDGYMMMALQLVPGGELIRGLSRYTKHADNLPKLQGILKKMSESKTLTDLEEKIYIELANAFKKYIPELGPKLSKYSFLFLRSILKKLPLLGVMKFLRKLFKGSKFIGKFVFKIGRIVITFDQLWILLSTRGMERARDKSELASMLRAIHGYFTQEEIDNMWEVNKMLYNPDGTINSQGQDSLKNGVIDGIVVMIEQYDSDNLIQALVKNSEIQPESNDEKVLNVKNLTPKPSPVTIDSILSGKQTIRKGQKGQVVEEIQRMLLFLGYDLGETGKKGAGIDRDFGDTTEKAVEKFQKDNKLKDTSGVVGKETLTLLIKQFKDATG
jgi:hypothetical protein